MLNDAGPRKALRHLSSSNVFERTQFKERLVAKLKFAETSILPALEQEIAKSALLVTKYSSARDD